MENNVSGPELEGIYQAKMYNFWLKNSKLIIASIILIVVGIITFFAYKSYLDDMQQKQIAKIQMIAEKNYPIFDVVDLISTKNIGVSYLMTTSAFKYYSENSKYNDAAKVLNVFLSFHKKGPLADQIRVRLHLFDSKDELLKIKSGNFEITQSFINLEFYLKNKDYKNAMLMIEKILKSEEVHFELRSKMFILKEELKGLVK